MRLWTSAAVVMVAIGALLPLGSASGAAITWAVGAVGLGCVAASVRSLPAQALLAAVSCILVLGVVPTSLTALGASPTWVCAAAVVAGVAIVAVVQVPGTPVELRLTLEPVGWAGAGIAVVAALAYGLVPGSLALTVAGAGAVVIGLVSQDRRPAAVVGSGLLGAAYVLRLLAAGVDVVEVYTAPFAVVLLVVGGIVMARRPGSRTAVTLFPGLVLATLPSLPGALEDPLSLRGLLLALGAVVMLVVGVAVRWQAPLLLGAALVTILALRQLGPYLGDTPRWIPLSVLGAALLVVGATWEARVANARAAVAYVRRLR